MRRREFVGLVGWAAAWPIAVLAQEPDRVRRVGYLSPATGFNPVDEAFEKSLQQLGWVKDRNIKIEYRYTGGRQDKVGPLVAEVIGLGLDLFVAWSPPVALGVKQAAPQSPLVFLAGSDVIEVGLVSNLARPGGNVTGISAFASEQIVAKRLELLKEVIPSLARMAVLFSTKTRSSGLVAALTASARAFGVELDEVEDDPRVGDRLTPGTKMRLRVNGCQRLGIAVCGQARDTAPRV